jgi:hypothetical protein
VRRVWDCMLCACVSEEGEDGEGAGSETPSLLSYILRYVSLAELGTLCRVGLRDPMHLCIAIPGVSRSRWLENTVRFIFYFYFPLLFRESPRCPKILTTRRKHMDPSRTSVQKFHNFFSFLRKYSYFSEKHYSEMGFLLVHKLS